MTRCIYHISALPSILTPEFSNQSLTIELETIAVCAAEYHHEALESCHSRLGAGSGLVQQQVRKDFHLADLQERKTRIHINVVRYAAAAMRGPTISKAPDGQGVA